MTQLADRDSVQAIRTPRAGGSALVSGRGLLSVLRRWDLWVLLITSLYAALFVIDGVRTDVIGFDFEGTLWKPALAIRDGQSPYPTAVEEAVDVGHPALYPPLLMFVAMPFTLLPWAVGLALWTVLLAGAITATLAILGVRDLRCYAVAALSLPAVGGLIFGNGTLLLVPLVALAWRWRARPFRAGIVVGAAIAAKLFLWPLLVWLLATWRFRAFGAAVGATAVGVLLPWAAIGFKGMTAYPDLLHVAEDVYAVHSYSVATLLSGLGAGNELASRSALTLGVAVAGVALVVGRRGLDGGSLALAVLAGVLGSPIVWPYYFALLLVPLAIARPRFSMLWAAFALYYVLELLPREDYIVSSADAPATDVPLQVWVFTHAPPAVWPALGYALAAATLVVLSARAMSRAKPSPAN